MSTKTFHFLPCVDAHYLHLCFKHDCWLYSAQYILRSCAGQYALPAHYTGLSDHHSHVLYSVVQKAADILRLLWGKWSKLSIHTGLNAHHAHAQIFRKMRLYDTIQQVAFSFHRFSFFQGPVPDLWSDKFSWWQISANIIWAWNWVEHFYNPEYLL